HDITNNQTLSFHGTAEPGALVALLNGNTVIGETVADGSTTQWELTVAAPFVPGGAILSARATDAAGDVTSSPTLLVTVDTSRPTTAITREGGHGDHIHGVDVKLGYEASEAVYDV